MRLRLFAVICLCFMSLSSIAFGLSADYRMVELGALGGDASRAYAINDQGQVVGFAQLPPSYNEHGDPMYYNDAFLWDPVGGMQDLGSLYMNSIGYGVNNSGQVVGKSFIASQYVEEHAFTWNSADGMHDLGTPGQSSVAYDINNIGQICGVYSGNAVVWNSDGTMENLGSGGAKAINDSGQVIIGANDSSHNHRAFIWDSTNGRRDIGTLGGTYSYAYDINAEGAVVGYSGNASGLSHAFIWDAVNGMYDLGGVRYSYAYGINDSGQVVGLADGLGNGNAFIWDRVNGMRSLGIWMDMDYVAINNAGWIAGTRGDGTAVVLIPVPEPSSVLVLAGGLGFLMSSIKRKKI